MAKSDLKSPVAEIATERRQNAALCWRMHRGKIEVLLITSRDTGRWVIPKGWPMDNRSASEAAAIEAWEEAGVTGAVSDQDLGLFGYEKILQPTTSVQCLVRVFPLRVANLADKFPERKQRRRKWFTVEKAAKKVAEPELRRLLNGLSPQVLDIPAAQALAQP